MLPKQASKFLIWLKCRNPQHYNSQISIKLSYNSMEARGRYQRVKTWCNSILMVCATQSDRTRNDIHLNDSCSNFSIPQAI